MHTVTMGNWEEYAILRADGELDAAGQAALEAFLGMHPELAEEAQLFDAIRLEPDETLVFAGKESLLKPEPRVIRLDTRRVMWAAAASIALLIGATMLLRSDGDAGTGASGSLVASRVKLNTFTNRVITPQASTPVVEKGTGSNTASAQPAIAKRAPSPASNVPVPAITPQHTAVPEVNVAAVSPLSTANSRLLAVGVAEKTKVELTDAVPVEFPPVQNAQKGESGLLARLAPDADRLQLVNDLRDKASERLTALRSTREKLRNTDVTVSVGNRDLFTLHF